MATGMPGRANQMSQGSDRGLFAGGRSARGRSESPGQAWGPAADLTRQISKARAMSSSAF